MKHIEAAITTLTDRRHDLTEGINSVRTQQDHLDELRKQVARAEQNIAADKQTLVEIDNALALLRAGESA